MNIYNGGHRDKPIFQPYDKRMSAFVGAATMLRALKLSIKMKESKMYIDQWLIY